METMQMVNVIPMLIVVGVLCGAAGFIAGCFWASRVRDGDEVPDLHE